MANLDSILNVAIPVGVVLVFAGIFYSKLKTPLGYVGRWIKSLFGMMSEGMSSGGGEKVYEFK